MPIPIWTAFCLLLVLVAFLPVFIWSQKTMAEGYPLWMNMVVGALLILASAIWPPVGGGKLAFIMLAIAGVSPMVAYVGVERKRKRS